MEKRFVELSGVECRADGDELKMSGYAVKFNEPSGLLYGEFIEYIEPRAFDGVDMGNVFMLYNHNSDYVLGNTRSNTLSLTVTEVGLRFDVSLPNTAKAKEVHELVKRGDINGMSFGFTVEEHTWNTKNEPMTRHIGKIGSLLEVSVVPFPAYESTEVDARTVEYLTECKECRTGVSKLLNNPLFEEAKQIIKDIEK